MVLMVVMLTHARPMEHENMHTQGVLSLLSCCFSPARGALGNTPKNSFILYFLFLFKKFGFGIQ